MAPGGLDDFKDKEENSTSTRAIARAIDLLCSFTFEKPVRGVSELARETRLPKSTVHRILSILQSKGFVEQVSDKGDYRLGIRLFNLGGVVRQQLTFGTRVSAHLERLLAETGETVLGVILDGRELVYVHVLESHHSLKVAPKVGARRPAHFGVSGRVFLAWKPPDEVSELLPADGLEAYTPRSITSVAQFMQELKKIRHDGYALEVEHYVEGVVSMAAPVFDYSRQVVGAVMIIMPKTRADADNTAAIIEKLVETTRRASLELGYTESSL